MVDIPTSKRLAALVFALLCLTADPRAALAQSDDGLSQTKDGLTAYIGVTPSAVVKKQATGESPPMMQSGMPSGRHEVHVVVAMLEAASGARVSDANVTAQVSGLALVGPIKSLEAMEIANTITYGGFFDMAGSELYTVKLTIMRPGAASPVVMELSYDHRS
jgi:hypothetical protein